MVDLRIHRPGPVSPLPKVFSLDGGDYDVGSMILLDLVGGVALLLWGLHMVHSGVVRAFGSDLRRFLGMALRNRFLAVVAGIFVTALLQSSTATGLMTASFVTGGAVDLAPALAIMLGANVGTTLIVQMLSFNVSALAPVLFLIGVTAFKRGGQTRTRDLGRVAIGVGLMVLSLHILLDTLAPAENAPAVRTLLGAMTDEPLLCVLMAAALTWAAHSSVTVVLLVMSLAYSHFIAPEAALALILGANLGSAINPLIEGSHSDNPASRRLPLGNLLNRVIGCALALPFLHPIAAALARIEPNPSRMAADFHTAFNVALALVFILPLNTLASALTRLLPDRAKPNDPSTPLYLDETALATPSVALVCAARETLHIGDIIETMLRQTMIAVMDPKGTRVAVLPALARPSAAAWAYRGGASCARAGMGTMRSASKTSQCTIHARGAEGMSLASSRGRVLVRRERGSQPGDPAGERRGVDENGVVADRPRYVRFIQRKRRCFAGSAACAGEPSPEAVATIG